MGLAGAEPGSLGLWLGDWSATPAAPGGLPVRLHAAEGEVAIDDPARTRLRVPKADLEPEVTPRLPDQELEIS